MAPRIMVIEDDRAILDLYQALLTAAGYEVALYADPQHALADVTRAKPAPVILDWIFSGQELGWITVQQLLLQWKMHSLQILVCTAAVHHIQQVEQALIAAGVPVLYKPFHTEDLLTAIRQRLAAGHVTFPSNIA